MTKTQTRTNSSCRATASRSRTRATDFFEPSKFFQPGNWDTSNTDLYGFDVEILDRVRSAYDGTRSISNLHGCRSQARRRRKIKQNPGTIFVTLNFGSQAAIVVRQNINMITAIMRFHNDSSFSVM